MQTTTLQELAAAIHGKIVDSGGRNASFGRIVTDSRNIRPGDVFWALPGAMQNGHRYVPQAVDRGAVACVVTEAEHDPTQSPCVLVADTVQALGQFSAWHRQRQEALVIGVTGTVGKTTTREMVHHVLSGSFQGIQSQKNYNNHVGLPLSLLQITPADEFAVVELGASSVGEIGQLADWAQVEAGVVTSIGEAHLEGFGQIEDIARAKGELVDAVPSAGFVVLNADETWTRKLADRAAAKVVLVGESPASDVRATAVVVENSRLTFQVGVQPYVLNVVGRHHLGSALSAIAIGREIGISEQDIAYRLSTFSSVAGRCHRLEIGAWTIIDDAYNSSPSSMRAACQVLADWQGSARRIMVCGDMLELGASSARLHSEMGRQVAAADVDHLLVMGDWSQEVIHSAREAGMQGYQLAECGDLESALVILDCWLEPGDVVLIKGSRATRMDRIVERLKKKIGESVDQTLAGAMAPTRI
jgi:UDP-N-acetylmuramoyl-tripeptide--D-alanyl-D-alanine ligase